MSRGQTPIDIGKVIQSAAVFDFKKWAVSTPHNDSLPRSIARLFPSERNGYGRNQGHLGHLSGRDHLESGRPVAVQSHPCLPPTLLLFPLSLPTLLRYNIPNENDPITQSPLLEYLL